MKDMPEEAQRIQRGRDDIRVMVRYPRKQRQSLGSLENMRAGPGRVQRVRSRIPSIQTSPTVAATCRK